MPDGHAKNFALLYEPGGRVRLAPRYDIVPTRLDDSLTDELAYSLGEAKTLDEVTPSALDAFFQALGIENAAGRKRLGQRYPREIAFELASRLKGLESTRSDSQT